MDSYFDLSVPYVHVSSDFIRRELMLKNAGFVAVNILCSSKVSVKGLKVCQRNFGWPFRWVDGSSLAEMVVGVSTRCDPVDTGGVHVLSINVAIVEERRC